MVWIILVIVIAVFIGCIILQRRKKEQKKYYEAAYRMVKEVSLTKALRHYTPTGVREQKIMVYLKWKDTEKRGYVFAPENGIRIGRTPEANEVCIRNDSVSGSHCVLYLSNNRLAIQDLNSVNGTWIQRGFKKHEVQQMEYVCDGDILLLGGYKIKITIFTFDMAYM